MGLGKKKGNGGGDEEAQGRQNMRRKKGESGAELVRRLGHNVADRTKCPTCKGEGTEQIMRNKRVGREIVKVANTETCRTCRGVGEVQGRSR